MAEIIITETKEQYGETIMSLAAIGENGETQTTGGARFCQTSFGKGTVPTMTLGGVGTPVHYRRGGNVRKLFEFMHERAEENGMAVSILHPFSFSYYRKFGYEKVADHLIMRMPVRMIDCVPRYCDLRPFDGSDEMKEDLKSIYRTFAGGRNLLIAREHCGCWGGLTTYIYYDEEGKPAGYVGYTTTIDVIVNHLGNGLIKVFDMAYVNLDALKKLLGFLRMFEGEFDEIEFQNLAMSPEVDLMLGHYTHTTYRLVPDIMARVMHTEKMLAAHDYPMAEGCFTVRIADDRPYTKGVYRVNYGGGEGQVQKLSDSADADMTLSIQAFSRLIYGYDGANAATAAYMPGVEITGSAEDFFRAFPKKPCGIFEHF